MDRHPLRWWALAVAIVAILVDMIDNQIVTVALPTIKDQFGAGDAALQWISAGYALGFALTLITGGRLGDRYGTKRLFLLGMTTFTIASLVAGLAPGIAALITARIVQGVGSGLMAPQVMSFVYTEFGDVERSRAMAICSSAFPIGGLAGPLLGGVITQGDLFGLGWRAIFLVNVPFGVLAVLGALLTMSSHPGTPGQRIDRAGLALLTAGLFALFYPVVQGRELHWPVWMIMLLVAAVPLLGAFALQQRALARRGGEPLIPSDLLRYRNLTAGQLVLFTINAATGVFFVLTLHLQLRLGYSPLETALTFLPSAAGIVLGGVVAVRLAVRMGRRLIAAAMALLAASLAAMAILVGVLGPKLDAWALLGPAVGFGLGMGVAMNSLIIRAMADVHPMRAGSASGLLNTTVQLGVATGIASFGTVFFARLPDGFEPATMTALALGTGVLVAGLLCTAVLPSVRRAGGPPVGQSPQERKVTP
ncbi:MFS transporter [Amycolatopsis jiangsuensis]|uniref:EmrB/QacA subfamily drug resistance transporter n=1 Tax=Amycolatopsis jiangsuensis TaxID=1181879 RepID=A0A840IZD4_9PSEU|nr:MFS transporter [Amycolatopsis jiangsuensis]MBB4686775.1 EmrB/QacA subfamily drug resistance transporter [Amycolatopsis jiangsuensis]